MEIIKLVADIIKVEMDIPNERIMIYNQKWNLPNIQEMFIYLGYLADPIIASNRYYEDREDGFYEVQTLQKMTSLSINVFSANDEARLRKEEIILALSSTYAQQRQEKYGFKVFRIPSGFTDISQVEASRMLNRYNITIDVINQVKKEKKVDYYDKYSITTKINL
jgi:hypothetical protein